MATPLYVFGATHAPLSRIVRSGAMAFNIDADVINASWLRIVARMRRLRERQPDLSPADAFRRAVRAHLRTLRASRGNR